MSTATSSPSGAKGTPIASATGPAALTRLIAPGSEGELISVSAATAAPAVRLASVIGTPVKWAM